MPAKARIPVGERWAGERGALCGASGGLTKAGGPCSAAAAYLDGRCVAHSSVSAAVAARAEAKAAGLAVGVVASRRARREAEKRAGARARMAAARAVDAATRRLDAEARAGASGEAVRRGPGRPPGRLKSGVQAAGDAAAVWPTDDSGALLIAWDRVDGPGGQLAWRSAVVVNLLSGAIDDGRAKTVLQAVAGAAAAKAPEGAGGRGTAEDALLRLADALESGC